MKLDHIDTFHSDIDTMITKAKEAIIGHRHQIKQIEDFIKVCEATGRDNKHASLLRPSLGENAPIGVFTAPPGTDVISNSENDRVTHNAKPEPNLRRA